MSKAKKARAFINRNYQNSNGFTWNNRARYIKKKPEQKTLSLDLITEIIREFKVISWDTESQPASSEEVEEDKEEKYKIGLKVRISNYRTLVKGDGFIIILLHHLLKNQISKRAFMQLKNIVK